MAGLNFVLNCSPESIMRDHLQTFIAEETVSQTKGKMLDIMIAIALCTRGSEFINSSPILKDRFGFLAMPKKILDCRYKRLIDSTEDAVFLSRESILNGADVHLFNSQLCFYNSMTLALNNDFDFRVPKVKSEKQARVKNTKDVIHIRVELPNGNILTGWKHWRDKTGNHFLMELEDLKPLLGNSFIVEFRRMMFNQQRDFLNDDKSTIGLTKKGFCHICNLIGIDVSSESFVNSSNTSLHDLFLSKKYEILGALKRQI